MNPTAPPNPWSWNRRNLTALLIVAVVLAAGVGWRLARRRATVGEDLTVRSADMPPAAELEIDPNTANWATLALLPGIAEAKAKAICRWREEKATTRPGATVFTCPADLDDVPGINLPTIERIAPHLTFPGEN